MALNRRQLLRTGLGGLGVAALASVLAVLAGPPAFAATVRVLTVRPHANLGSPAVVNVSGVHLSRNASLDLVECAADGYDGCSILYIESVTTSATGRLAPTKFEVASVYGSNRDGTVTCSSFNQCRVNLEERNGSVLASALISFKS